MKTYLVLKEKARRFNEDEEIQGLLTQIREEDASLEAAMKVYDPRNARRIRSVKLDRKKLAHRNLPYERLDS